MSTPHVQNLCSELRAELICISDERQKRLLAQIPSPKDIENALEALVLQLQKTCPNSKFDQWLGKTKAIVETLSPVIDAAVELGGSFSPGPLIWNSVKIILQVRLVIFLRIFHV